MSIKQRAVARAFGRSIGEERARQGISQSMLGAYLGVSQSTVSRLERGKVGSRRRMARVFRTLCRLRWNVEPSRARRRRTM